MKRGATLATAGFAFFAVVASCCMAAGETAAGGLFTRDQVVSGREEFVASCAGCHQNDLSGDGGPALVGSLFSAHWAHHTTAELYKFVQSTMPACRAGSLSDTAYAQVVAYLLWANGARPGDMEFDPSAGIKIETVITGTSRFDPANDK